MPSITDEEYISIKIPKLSKSEIDRIIKEINVQRENIRERLKRLSAGVK